MAEGHKNAELLNFIVIGVILLNTVVIALEADHPDYKSRPLVRRIVDLFPDVLIDFLFEVLRMCAERGLLFFQSF